jgi:hypothetical protein|nr:nucleotidyltransferase domain-containing protein [Neorhizobium tomejilense]
MENTVLARIVHGSHLFGLNTPESDRDFVSVVLPSTERILLGDVNFISDEGSTSDDNRRNTSVDIDDKQISLSQFIRMTLAGDLIPIELLNAPLDFHLVEPHPLFLHLRDQREKLASRNFVKIVGFCRSQAVTYSPRRDRLIAAQKARDTLVALGVTETTKEVAGEFFGRVVDACASEYVKVVSVPNNNGKPMDHLDICGKMVAGTVHAKIALDVASSSVKRYGRRVHDAASTNQRDWKSLSHALRIATEGYEYVTTGSITLPVPNRERLLDVKLGRVSLEEVTEEVDSAVRRLEVAAAASTLPEAPDEEFARRIVMAAHGERVIREYPELEDTLSPMGLMLSEARGTIPLSGSARR